MLSKLPYNRDASTDLPTVIAELAGGSAVCSGRPDGVAPWVPAEEATPSARAGAPSRRAAAAVLDGGRPR